MLKTILGIGAAHIDRRGQFDVDFVPGASHPGALREDFGGGMFNALRNLAQRGAEAWLLSVRGGDIAGAVLADAIEQSGIRDLSVIFLDRSTPGYTALLDRHGEVVAALADMKLYELAIGKQLRRSSVRAAISAAAAIFCDANLAADALAKLALLAKGKPVFALAISPTKAVRLRGILPDLACLFLNAREARALTGETTEGVQLADALLRLGVRRAVVTDGPRPVIILDPQQIFSLTPPPPKFVMDVTGAGDALAGAAVAALMRGAPFLNAVREGMAAARLTLESARSVAHYDDDAFAAALADVPAPTGVRHVAANSRLD